MISRGFTRWYAWPGLLVRRCRPRYPAPMGAIRVTLVVAVLATPSFAADPKPAPPTPEQVLTGVRAFLKLTAKTDGSFRPGVDPDYEGMSDSAYSDLAPAAYAV